MSQTETIVREILGKTVPKIAQRGRTYARDGRVERIERPSQSTIRAVVRGRDRYRVEIERRGDRLRFSCTRPYSWGGVCKHVVAAALAAKAEAFAPEPRPPRDVTWRRLIEPRSEVRRRGPRIVLAAHLYRDTDGWRIRVSRRIFGTTGEPYGPARVVKDPRTLRTADGSVAADGAVGRPRGIIRLGRADPEPDDPDKSPLLTVDLAFRHGATVIERRTPKVSIRVKSGIDWFDVEGSVSFDGAEIPLARVLAALRGGRRFVPLGRGRYARLPQEWARRLLGLELGEPRGGGIRLSRAQAAVLNETIRNADQAETDAAFRKLARGIAAFRSLEPVPVPAPFRGRLRRYQEASLAWFAFLRKFRFGGCLCDDMGLGKTVQVLALLAGEVGRKPSLVVAPKSVIDQWTAEARKFAPNLGVRVHHGPGRPKTARTMLGRPSCDLFVTTYGTLLRDADEIARIGFRYAVLDESQIVKNPLAQMSRAVRRIRADHRLVLTGTPVENSVLDLWSQMAFANPGLLGPLHRFKRRFAVPIDSGRDKGAAETLRRTVRPFLLRRNKEQVARELPPKTEQEAWCEMSPAQKRLYERIRSRARAEVLSEVDRSGMAASRMLVLEALLRLRQVACRPALIEEILSEDHKVLVFSQFVAFLDLVAPDLDSRGVGYVRLDGRTRDRAEAVSRFRSDPAAKVFLLSLKAGGGGLNLDAADYVILLDPWWNPAVERQAMDRAHRIGRKRPVFLYRLLTKGTIEEKVRDLQARKLRVADAVVRSEKGFAKGPTRDDPAFLLS